MANPVVVEFVLRGMPEVARAIRSIEQAAAASERARASAAERASRQRTSVEEQAAKAKIRAMLKADAEVRRAQDRATKETARAAQQRVREEELAARAMERAAERTASAKLRAARHVDREIARIERTRLRENDRLQREGLRLEEKTHREQTKMLAARERDRERFARGTGTMVGRAGRAGVSTAANLAGRAAGMLGQLGGGFSIADAVEREVGMHRIAGKIAASTVVEPGKERPRTAEIVGRARAAGRAQGVDPKDILEGVEKFKDLTGDTSRALDIMPELAKLATAFGADVGELAENAGNIALSMPEGTSNEDIMRLLRVQTRQGAVGAVELKDMAQLGGRLTAGAGLFEGDRATNIASMGAFAQIARQRGGAASPAEAALASQRFATDVAAKADVLEKQGIDVRGKGGKLRDPRQILMQMLEKTGGDVTKIKGLGLGERSARVMTGIADIYSQAGGGKKGLEAADRELRKFTSGVSDAEVNMRARERLQDADKQLERAMIELRSAVGTELLPEFLKMIPVLRDAMPILTRLLAGFAHLADWAIRNPLSGLGVLMGAAFAKELAIAGVGKLMERALMSSAAGKTLAIGTAVMAIALAKMMIEQEFKEESEAATTAVNRQLEAQNLVTKIARGEGTAEDTARAQELMGQLKGDAQKQIELRESPGIAKTASAAMANIIAPEEAKEAALAEEHNRQETMRMLNDTMKGLAAAIEKNTRKQGESEGGTAPGRRPAAASTGIAQRTQ